MTHIHIHLLEYISTGSLTEHTIKGLLKNEFMYKLCQIDRRNLCINYVKLTYCCLPQLTFDRALVHTLFIHIVDVFISVFLRYINVEIL